MRERLERVYEQRFPSHEPSPRDGVWRELGRWFQRWIASDARVIDIACDRGHFIRNIAAAERWASDLRDVSGHLGPDVTFVQSSGLDLGGVVPAGHFDVAFMSNYLEHLPAPEAVVAQLEVVRDLLRPGGRVIVLQPNIRLVGGHYWDFIDHRVPLTERSLEEAALTVGLETERLVTRFLPYSTKGRLPSHPLLVRAYLAFPPAWWLMGRQTLYVGRRPVPSA